jgi:hypothetical protein
MLPSLILIDTLSSSACWEKKEKIKEKKRKKANGQEAFSPRPGHVLLAGLHGIFVDVRCN